MDKRLKNISNAFGASLSFGFEKEANKDYSLGKEDLVIKKYAGINIYQPTAENIELFVRRYVLSELAHLHRTLNVDIQLTPQEMDSANEAYVSEATGTVRIKFMGKVVELPFLVMDGELVPFDVIQIEGQRVPYSRENIEKVFYGLEQLANKKNANTTDDAYLDVADRVNPSTSPGFLGNVLQIRDQAVATGGNHFGDGSQFIYASEMADELLEKVGSLKELTKENLKELELMFEKKAHEEVKAELEKTAATSIDPMDDTQLKLFEKVKNLNFDNAIDLPNGTVIGFPEKDGNEIAMTYGIVVDNFLSFADKAPNKVKLVVSEDGRIKILSNSERFLCLKAPNASFRIPQDHLSTLEDGDVFMGFDGDKALFPCNVEYINEVSYGSGDRKNDISTKVYNVFPIYDNSGLASILSSSEYQNILDSVVSVSLCTLDGAKFAEMPYGDFIAAKAKEMDMDEFKLSNLMRKSDICIRYRHSNHNDPFEISNPGKHRATNMVLATDPETKVIKIKGVIKDYIRDKADLDKLAYVEHEEDVFEKAAALEKNKIKITLVDRKLGAYNVDVNYVDESKLTFKRFVKSYNRISREDLEQMLRILGYNNVETQEIIYKANNNPSITYALPQNPNIQALAGTKTKTLAMQKMENTLKSMINPKDLATALATTIISNMVSDTLAKSSNKAQEMAARIGSYASEGKALSSAFEKIAMDKQNEEMLSVARLMSLSTLFNEKVASTLNESHVYPRIYDTAKDIMEERAVLEKTAYNLMQLKAKQYKERNEIVNPNYIQGAVEQLDKLYKVAYGVCSAKYDMNKIMEKEAAYNFKKLSPSRLQRAMTKVSKKTGIPEKTIAAVLVGTAVTGTGVGVTGAKLAEKKKMAKTAGAASSALTGGLLGGLYGAGKNYDKAVKKEKEKNPEVLPSDYGPVATSKALSGAAKGAALGTLGGASAGAIHSKLKEVKAKKQLAKVMKEMTNDPSWGDLFKHADMNVPTEEEKKKESNVTDDEDLADISCEVCGYQGKPDYQGFCPKCGTLGGIKPKAIAPAQDEMLTPSHDLGGNIYDESAHAFEDII